MRTFTGRLMFPLDPRPEEIHVDDVAHGLANTCRYAGQCLDYYSVAEHSVIVSLYVEKLAMERGADEATARAWALEALLHDAAEAYVRDLIWPLKHIGGFAWMVGYRQAEGEVQVAAMTHFARWIRPCPESAALIHEVDGRVLVDEIGSLICDVTDEDMEEVAREHGPALGAAIACMMPNHAESVFLQRFAQLCEDYE